MKGSMKDAGVLLLVAVVALGGVEWVSAASSGDVGLCNPHGTFRQTIVYVCVCVCVWIRM
jgi:hypothetical protein